MEDPDTGACPPCEIEWDLEVAKKWDAKGKKWFGMTAVDLYYKEHPDERPWWRKLTAWLQRRP